MHYLIGDVQGCCDALDRLLAEIGFSPSRDSLHVLGDLVARGPESLRTLHTLQAMGSAATCLLGNHDLHLLAVAEGVHPVHPRDTIGEILTSPDREALLEWLRHRKLADRAHGWLLLHAGVVPQWSADDAMARAAEIEALLVSAELPHFLHRMYGNTPGPWSDPLTGVERWRFIVNTLTRIRFCTDDGVMDFVTKEGAGHAPPGYRPWFEVPGRASAGTPIAFGHWSTLGLRNQPDLLAIDTGCVWGGHLTAVRVDSGHREVIQVACEQAQVPG